MPNERRAWAASGAIAATSPCPTPGRRDMLRQYAIWDFAEVPADLAGRDKPMLFEFAFDIFRLSKGEEGQGVNCTFTFAANNITSAALEATTSAASKELVKRGAARQRSGEIPAGGHRRSRGH